MKQIITTHGAKHNVDTFPNECPYCHKSITPHLAYGHQSSKYLEVFMYCPNSKCNRSFIAFYHYDNGYKSWEFSKRTTFGEPDTKVFGTSINEISPSFISIYNQAYFAEQHGLFEICGVGYRKALEYLIKDYAIGKCPEEKKDIEKKQLGPCIEKWVTNDKIKSVAKRGAWLGNDETHYVRKWEGKNLDDLKALIELTVLWIDMEYLSNRFEIDMPD